MVSLCACVNFSVPKLRGRSPKCMTALSQSPQRGTDLSPNADSEKAFSIVGKIYSDQRPSLSQETLISLMIMKFNCLQCCHESTFTEELLTEVRATSKAVKS